MERVAVTISVCIAWEVGGGRGGERVAVTWCICIAWEGGGGAVTVSVSALLGGVRVGGVAVTVSVSALLGEGEELQSPSVYLCCRWWKVGGGGSHHQCISVTKGEESQSPSVYGEKVICQST